MPRQKPGTTYLLTEKKLLILLVTEVSGAGSNPVFSVAFPFYKTDPPLGRDGSG